MTENETVTVPKQQYDEMLEKLATGAQSNANMVEEIKDLRSKNQITEAEKKELLKKIEERVPTPAGDLTPEKVSEMATEAARKILGERDSKTAQENKEAAKKLFLEKHKEFHPDNDQGGIKYSALERKLERLSQDGLTSQEDFMSLFEDARNLAVGAGTVKVEPGTDPNPFAPSGGGRSATVRDVPDDQLSSKELKYINERFEGDKERFLKIRAKRPEYVSQLLQYYI